MMRRDRTGTANTLHVLAGVAVGALLFLAIVLLQMGKPRAPEPRSEAGSTTAGGVEASEGLTLYCAAGVRPPVEQIVANYAGEPFGTSLQVQYGGSNTLLSQIEVSQTGDLYIAADDTYMVLAREKGLVKETIPIGTERPVIAVPAGNPKNIQNIMDLLREDVKCALGNPGQAAVGKETRSVLQTSGHWEKLEQHVTKTGVFLPTVPEVANSVKLGSVDAGIVWDTTLALYPELEAVRTPELESGAGEIAIGVLTSAADPTKALRFARYLTARDKGLATFQKNGFQTVDGDKWTEVPELNFYCGSVNRRAVEDVIKAFEIREGVRVNTSYNGCGILTAKMKTIVSQDQGLGFPDTYMACDVYYLNNVRDMFQDDVEVSDTEVVIAVPKGNPKGIKTLKDLTQPGMKVSVGEPDQCTIGALTRQLLEKEGLYDEIMKNVVNQTPSSAMLVPTVVTNAVDAALAYATDTRAEADKIDSIPIPSAAAKAIQPFAIARSSDHKYLSRRFYKAIAEARKNFEAAGFHFRLDDSKKKVSDR